MIAKPEPHARVKARRKRKQAAADRAVYRAVTKRDDGCCRACGLWTGRMHRHHIRGRQHTTTADVCLLCERCHANTHVRVGGKRLIVTGNADERLDIIRRRDDGTWRSVEWEP